DTDNEFYGGTDPGACGTFLSTNAATETDTSYGPTVPIVNTRTPYTLLSHTGPTGSGTSADAYQAVPDVESDQPLAHQVSTIDAAGDQFPDTVDTAVSQDNGAGLSWPLSIAGGSSVTRSLLTAFSPTGQVPGSKPPTVAQQPPSPCKLRISRARVFLFRKHPR